jgi:hypothetical protein
MIEVSFPPQRCLQPGRRLLEMRGHVARVTSDRSTSTDITSKAAG